MRGPAGRGAGVARSGVRRVERVRMRVGESMMDGWGLLSLVEHGLKE